jgi:NAD(P)H-dependent FMN reductase
MKIVALSGSTRTASYNSALIAAAARMLREHGAEVVEVSLREHPIPLYDGDLEEAHGIPQNALALRREILDADALIVATPEYNGSISAVLKNAIDWVSRPFDGGRPGAAFRGKPVLLMSASPSAGGGTRALAHLEFIMRALGARVLDAKVSVPQAHEGLDRVGADLGRATDALLALTAGAAP